MKKSKYSLTVTAAVVAAALGGCRFAGQEVQDVYGPPIEATQDEGQEEIEPVYGPPIESTQEEVQDVYGPPIESLQEAVQEVYGPPIEEEQ